MNIKTILASISLLLASAAFAEELPDDSIYHIESDWLTQDKESINIKSLQGRVQVVAFVYTYCEHSCPVILAKLKYLQKNINQQHKDNIQFHLVSLDPKRDTPETMKQYMQDKKLDARYWQMLNGDPGDVLELSALVGVKYKPMNNEAADIAHSNMITVLDKQGRIHYQMKGLDADLDNTITEINNAALM